MNILLLTKNFDLGGAEVHVRELANELIGEGNTVHLASHRGRQTRQLDTRIRHHPLNFSEAQFPANFLKLSKLIKEQDIDLVHGHQRMPITLAAILGKRHRIPSIATVHGKIRLDIRSTLVRKLLSHVIVVSPLQLSFLDPDSSLRRKSSIIYNSTPPNSLNREITRDQAITYVSRIDRKHYRVLKDLVEKIYPEIRNQYPSVKLNIIGDGPCAHDLKELIETTTDDHIRNGITLHGYQEDPKSILAKSMLTLGVGRCAIESLSVNTPVISVNALWCGGLISMSNYQQLKGTNFVARSSHPYSWRILTGQILEFLARKDSCLNTNEGIHQHVLKDFSSRKMMKEIIELYESRLDGAP